MHFFVLLLCKIYANVFRIILFCCENFQGYSCIFHIVLILGPVRLGNSNLNFLSEKFNTELGNLKYTI